MVSEIDTEYIGSDGKPRDVFVQFSSSYMDDNVISYRLTKEPADLVLALGGLPETSVGGVIATSLPADVGALTNFVSEDDLSRLPIAFVKEQFLIVSAHSELPEEIQLQATPNKIIVVPVAVLSEEFEPIVTNAATLFVP